MGKLAKFFSKFSTDKFPKESQGRRLNENRPERDLKRLSNKSPPNAPRGPPSEGAQKAADAALSRIAAKQVPSKTPIQRRVEAENALLKKQMVEAEALAAKFTSSASTSDTTGLLQNDTVRGTYTEVDALIEKALLDEAEHDPAAAYSLLIIRSIDSSQYPVGVDASDPSTPSIQTFREKRRQNFITIIRNLVENPENENFRRLRMSNKLVADLLELRFALNFFETCGFTREEQSVVSDGCEKIEKFLVFPAAPTEQQSHHLKSMLNLLESGQLIVPKLNRDTAVFKVSESAMRNLAKEELPEEFFIVSRDDLRRWDEEAQRIETDKILLTKAMRDRLKARDRRVYRYALIRVRLPHDDIVIQGTFLASETVNDIRCWVSSCLADRTIEYNLWAPPGSLAAATGSSRPPTARVLLDDCDVTASLADLGLAPSALLTFSIAPSSSQTTTVQISSELNEQIVPLQ